VERLAETVAEAAGKLDALELEESYRLVQYADESLGRLLDALQYSVKDAKEAGALGPGGSQPELPVEGKETVVSKEGLAKYLELSASFSEERGWQELIGAYFSLIAR
jgi:hypothetical protein